MPNNGPVFKDDVVPRVDILIPPDSLAIMLAPGNEQSNYHWHATFIFDNGEIKDTLENIGFRLRGNTSRQADKQSFKVSFNTYEAGRKWYGLEKLNLNGEHNDPSVARSKICWDLLRDMGIPASRSNHVELYFNGEYRGLYVNVEHIDEEFVQLRFGNNDGNLFKCLWPADLNYKGSNPDLYKEDFGGRRAYDLRTNVDEDDYSDLAEFIDILNNTPLNDLPCELEEIFNVDDYLKVIAFDILTGNWDGPIFNKNNFYLYHNEATGQFEYIPYDLDNTIGIDWFSANWPTRNIYAWDPPNEYRPIYEQLLEVPEYRDRFSFYMDKIIAEIYHEAGLFPYIENMRDMIGPYVQDDPFYPLDYGFSLQDFEDSFDQQLPYFQTPTGVKEFITERRNSALAQLDNFSIAPIISEVANNYPNGLTDISITANVEDDEDVLMVEACYQVDGGALICSEMFDDGLHADGAAGDGKYGASIAALGTPGMVEYFVKATDNDAQVAQNPVCGTKQIFIGSSNVPLVINEFMASNATTIADENGEFDDWVEVFSLSDVPIYLGNYFLSDDEGTPGKWQMPDVWIQPEEYLIFWTDNDDGQGPFHTNFRLSAAGEFIGIFDSEANNYALIDGFAFGEQTTDIAVGRLPNGTGVFQQVNATPGAHNEPFTATEEKYGLDISVNISPNPFSDGLHVVLEKEFRENMELEICDAFGRCIYRNIFAGSEAEKHIDTSTFPPGVYFLKIKNEDGKMAVRKLILQR